MLSEHQFMLLLYGDKCDEITSANSANFPSITEAGKFLSKQRGIAKLQLIAQNDLDQIFLLVFRLLRFWMLTKYDDIAISFKYRVK